jgi:RNA polymerase sigma-70 factor (ECF subfamily)
LAIPFQIDFEGIRKGNEKAFKDLFINLFEKVCFYAFDYVRNWEVARELAQESFISLWETKENLKQDSNVIGFLFTVTRNKALNHLKHLTAENKYLVYKTNRLNQMQLNITALSDESTEKLISEELKNRVRKTIDTLPEKCKQVYIMSRNMGLSHKEISHRLEISVKTVENHITEALHRLRNSL